MHATSQWVHFDAPVARSLKSWVLGTNAQLPKSVRVADAVAVTDDFHARHSAFARSYVYLIANSRSEPALLANRCLWVREPLNVRDMHDSLQEILGERDFSAFRAASCQSRTAMRNVRHATVLRKGDYLQLRISANAFLHHMVRNIVGSTLEIGRGRQDIGWLAQLLASGDRTQAAATAAPQGLYLTDVNYPEKFGLKKAPEQPYLSS